VAKVTAAAAAGPMQQREREVKEPQLAQGLAGAAQEAAAVAMQQGSAGVLEALLLRLLQQKDADAAQRERESVRREVLLERKTHDLKRSLEQMKSKAAADGMQDSYKVTKAQLESQRLRAALAERMGQPYSCTEQQ
jgi:hypothetical protein